MAKWRACTDVWAVWLATLLNLGKNGENTTATPETAELYLCTGDGFNPKIAQDDVAVRKVS